MHAFYVSPNDGNDYNQGGIDTPFKTLDKALAVVSDRVNAGIYRDIYCWTAISFGPGNPVKSTPILMTGVTGRSGIIFFPVHRRIFHF
jgi:hypothetical protein